MNQPEPAGDQGRATAIEQRAQQLLDDPNAPPVVIASVVRDLLAELSVSRRLIADVLAEHADELDTAACDRCEQCGPVVMCSFHSVLSALQRQTWTNPAIERDNLKRQLQYAQAELSALRHQQEQLQQAAKRGLKSLPDDATVTRSDLLLWMAQRLELDGYKAFSCLTCNREGLIGIHALHTELVAAAQSLRPLRDAVDAAIQALEVRGEE